MRRRTLDGWLSYDGTMRRLWAIVGLSGCTFSGTSTVIDTGDDVVPTAACTISGAVGTLGPSLGEGAGGTNGIAQSPPQCPAGQQPIGAGFDTTRFARPEGGNPGDGTFGERVVTAIVIQCGTITRGSDGHFTTAAGAVVRYDANPCIGWDPTTTAPIVTCPAGTTLTGVDANDGASSLFNSVKLACASLTPAGTVGAPLEVVAVTDTGAYANKPQSASCPPGQALVGYGTRANCGVDQLTLLCAPLDCK